MRAGLRLLGLALWLLICLPPHLLSKALTGRSGVPPRFLGACAWIIGARVTTVGEPVHARTLIAANHLSWLDILILAGATGCRFVSKDDLGNPVVHWLADQNNTLYVRRSERSDSRNQADAIAAALEGPQAVTLFPEGTTGPGDALLPFRSTLLQAASSAGADVAVRPVAIDYGAAATEISWHDEPARDNVLRMLGRRGTFAVTVRLLEPLDRALDRKGLAREAHAAIAAAFFASNSPAASNAPTASNTVFASNSPVTPL